jgi:thymidylate kinase
LRFQRIETWLSTFREGCAIVLVDRLLVTCLALRERVDDPAGYKTILSALKGHEVIVPDLTFFLQLPSSDEEVAERRARRREFVNSDIIYDHKGYREFVVRIDRETVELNLVLTRSECYDQIRQRILDEIMSK